MERWRPHHRPAQDQAGRLIEFGMQGRSAEQPMVAARFDLSHFPLGRTGTLNVRLQKFLAEAGVASRRASEKIILEGRAGVNGRAVTELGSKIDPAHDKVTVDVQPLRQKRKLYVALNKPPGY